MTKKIKPFEMSDEFIIFRFRNGIKLVKPEEARNYTYYHLAYNTNTTLRDVLQMSLSFYFLDRNSLTKKINSSGADLCGYQSEYEAFGKSLYDVANFQSATILINNCKQVILENKISIFDELNIRKDGQSIPFLSIKSPWYDANNKIIGTFGCSICLAKHPLASSLELVKRLGLFNLPSFTSSSTIHDKQVLTLQNIHLTQRETTCLHLIAKGYTAKRMAQYLGISHRTVEEYIGNIKNKFGVITKSELIETAIEFVKESSETSA